MKNFLARAIGREAGRPVRPVSGRLPTGRWNGQREIWLRNAVGAEVDFSGISLESFSSDGGLLEDCDFRRTRFEDASFGAGRQTLFRECDFSGADLRHVDLGQARFERCTFEQALIDDWASDAAEFIDCHFAGRLTDCRFSGRPWGMWEDRDYLDPPRTANAFSGNDFRDAELIGCSFVRGIHIDAQLWPDSDSYIRLDRLSERVRMARDVVARWTDAHLREEALILLKIFSEIGYEEQDVLFANKWDLGLDRDALRQAWDVLTTVLPRRP